MAAPDDEPPRFELPQFELPESPEHEDTTGAEPPREDPPLDATTALGAAVTLLALAALSALLGQHFLWGWLRILAGVLGGAGVGSALLMVLHRRRWVLAGIAAALLALVLTVPAVLSARAAPLASIALASIPALADDDRVTSLPIQDSPVLVQRADGSGELLSGSRVDEIPAQAGEILALSAEGTRLLRVTGTAGEAEGPTTTVLDLTPDTVPVPLTALDGAPMALAGDLLVLRTCTEGTCRISGHDLSLASGDSTPVPALWTISDGTQSDPGAVRGADPAGIPLLATGAQPAGLLDALRSTGILREIALVYDPAQGWVQLDPATGFPQGQVLARPEQDCRIASTAAPPGPPSLQEPGAVVLTVCSQDDGAMTATAHRDGSVLWTSEPSPAGEWTVTLDQGRVLAAGTEQGSEVSGEIVAGEAQSAWTAPGGSVLQQASALTSRIGIDGARMVVTNDAGQLVAYDTADGENTWTSAVHDEAAAAQGVPGVRGVLGAGSAVVLDPAVRTAPLDARDARRLRIFDAATGEVRIEVVVEGDLEPAAAVGVGAALVTEGDRTLLLSR